MGLSYEKWEAPFISDEKGAGVKLAAIGAVVNKLFTHLNKPNGQIYRG